MLGGKDDMVFLFDFTTKSTDPYTFSFPALSTVSPVFAFDSEEEVFAMTFIMDKQAVPGAVHINILKKSIFLLLLLWIIIH